MKKYTLYAIGEIALVVIGILIALQINNWNERKKSRRIEIETLQDIRLDLIATNDDLLDDIATNEIIRSATLNTLNHILSEKDYHDSLTANFSLMLITTILYKKTSAYETLKSRGLETITSKSIRNGITDFYELSLTRAENSAPQKVKEILLPYMQKHFDINLNAIISDYWPTLLGFQRRLGSTDLGTLAGYIPKDYESLKSDTEFRVLLREAIIQRRNTIGRYNSSVQGLQNLIFQIEKELSDLKKNIK